MKFRLSLALLLPALVAGCSMTSTDDPDAPRDLRPLTAAEARVVSSGNTFGLKLFGALNAAAADENVFISPMSVSMALGMTLNGARGETQAAMRRTLAVAGLTEAEINASYRSLIDLLRGLDPEVTLEIANAIWYRAGFTPEPAFLQAGRTHFDAEVAALDFDAPSSVTAVNDWVKAQTHGRIDKIIDALEPNLVMLLANALYFKGTWTYAFDEKHTHDHPFTRLDGTASTVKMRAQEATFAYAEADGVQLLDLPYGDSLYTMTLVLPARGSDVNALAARLDDAQWNAWMARLAPQKLPVRIPRFKLEYEEELSDVLKALGMDVAFDCALADFTGIEASGGLCISFVKHKTFVEVNEEGTEAAAVTVVGIERTSVGPSFVVDRPFLLALRERHSGTVLFIGKVATL
jgi:serine protease inhibitor